MTAQTVEPAVGRLLGGQIFSPIYRNATERHSIRTTPRLLSGSVDLRVRPLLAMFLFEIYSR